jgi:hypothetical protein
MVVGQDDRDRVGLHRADAIAHVGSIGYGPPRGIRPIPRGIAGNYRGARRPAPDADATWTREPLGMDIEENDSRSLMNATGLGLLPGLALATALICAAMAALLTGSMWAVAGVLVLIVLCAAVVVYVVVAVTGEGDEGQRLRRRVPGLDDSAGNSR